MGRGRTPTPRKGRKHDFSFIERKNSVITIAWSSTHFTFFIPPTKSRRHHPPFIDPSQKHTLTMKLLNNTMEDSVKASRNRRVSTLMIAASLGSIALSLNCLLSPPSSGVHRVTSDNRLENGSDGFNENASFFINASTKETSPSRFHHRQTQESPENKDLYPEDFYNPPSMAPSTIDTIVPSSIPSLSSDKKPNCHGHRRMKSSKGDNKSQKSSKTSSKKSRHDSDDHGKTSKSKLSTKHHKSSQGPSAMPSYAPSTTPIFPSWAPNFGCEELDHTSSENSLHLEPEPSGKEETRSTTTSEQHLPVSSSSSEIVSKKATLIVIFLVGYFAN
jgi:hypothetical protein